MDWDNPQERFALIESVGPDEYNRRMQKHMDDSVVSTVNGYHIRPVNTRFGRLFMVAGTGTAYQTLELAEQYANSLEPNEKDG
jgi:predicted helicase